MDQESVEYYVRRSAKERKLAKLASDPKVAKVHSELAEHYERLVDSQQTGGASQGQAQEVAVHPWPRDDAASAAQTGAAKDVEELSHASRRPRPVLRVVHDRAEDTPRRAIKP